MKHLLLFKAWLLFLFWVLPVEIHSATTMEDTNFSYSYCIGGVQITKFHGSYNEYRTITIPKTFRGQKVVKIGNFAAQVRKSVDSPPGMLTEDHHHTVH